MRDFVQVSAPSRHMHQPPDECLGDVHGIGDVTNARRTIWLTGEHRLDRSPDLLLFRRELDLVARATDPGAIECNLARLNELSQRCSEEWNRQRWLISGLAQLLESNARLFRVLLVERIEQLANTLSETLPAVGQHRGSAVSVRKSDEPQF